MTHRFKLHAHEVWREKLVREGVYSQSGDFRAVLPQGVWEESRFVFGRYSPRGREDSLVGHIVFRPEHGAEADNFFCAVDVYGNSSQAEDTDFCKLGEFVFGGEDVDLAQVQRALARGLWGRVFYLNEQGLRGEGEEMPCDWGIFLGANGLGLWKWTMRDGVNWGKASSDGLFRWHDEQRAAQFLANHSSLDVWNDLKTRLASPASEIAFARRWLESDEEDRLGLVIDWKNGSLLECETVVRWLLLTEPELLCTRRIVLHDAFFDLETVEDWEVGLHCDDIQKPMPPRLKRALNTLRNHFDAKIKANVPSCARNSYIDNIMYFHVDEPTAHERLEAHQQLQA